MPIINVVRCKNKRISMHKQLNWRQPLGGDSDTYIQIWKQ